MDSAEDDLANAGSGGKGSGGCGGIQIRRMGEYCRGEEASLVLFGHILAGFVHDAGKLLIQRLLYHFRAPFAPRYPAYERTVELELARDPAVETAERLNITVQ